MESVSKVLRGGLCGAPVRTRGASLRIAATTLAALAAWMATPSALAAPVFSVTGIAAHNSGAGCASFGWLTSSSSVSGDAACLNSTSAVAATASGGGLGAFAAVQHFGGVALVSGATARAQTSFVITGAPGYIDVSLNLVLDSEASGTSISTVFIDASIFGFGDVNEVLGSTDGGLLIPSVDCNGCFIRTKTISLAANQVYDFGLALSVTAGAGDPFYQGSIDALNTLTFPSFGPVFNLPDGYTASIDGMNVVDNRVVPPAAGVPEPGSLAMTAGGLISLLWLRRRGNGAPRRWSSVAA